MGIWSFLECKEGFGERGESLLIDMSHVNFNSPSYLNHVLRVTKNLGDDVYPEVNMFSEAFSKLHCQHKAINGLPFKECILGSD
jgi:hypothetical protein